MTQQTIPIPDPTPDLTTAREAFNLFVRKMEPREQAVALHDSDADGVTAGVIWQRCFERLGFRTPKRAIPDRMRNAWTAENRTRVEHLKPAHLFVMDLGSDPEPVLQGVPTCFIDHHRPGGVGERDTLISAYTWDPIPNTSLLIWDLCCPLADLSDLDWVAAIGAISDLGDGAPFDLVRAAKKKYTAKYLKEVTTLINAARRSSWYDPEAAARALLIHSSPRELFDSPSADVKLLREARIEVKAALEEAKKAAPTFSGKVALLRLHSPCQVHPLVAQIWRTRLPQFIVIAANDQYVPGRVNFSARSARGESVLEFLRSVPLSEGEGSYANGHDQASGGSLPVERWNELLAAMEFSEDVFAGR